MITVTLSIAEAAELADAFKLCYRGCRLPRDIDKQVRKAYGVFASRIEEAEALVRAEQNARYEKLIKDAHDACNPQK